MGKTAMGIRNYLVEGGSGSGKTAVATELETRDHHAVHGDRVLAYQGDPETGARLDPRVIAAHRDDPAFIHDHHIWDAGIATALAADRTYAATFFCGGARNIVSFLELFDAVFVLEIDRAMLERRLDNRTDEWGSAPPRTRPDVNEERENIDMAAASVVGGPYRSRRFEA